jgi:hypothetical protein
MKADEKVTEGKFDDVRESCEEGEAKWLCKRLAIAAGRFPRFVAATFAQAFKYEFGSLIDTVIALRDQMKTVCSWQAKTDERLTAAGKYVKSLEKRIAELEKKHASGSANRKR